MYSVASSDVQTGFGDEAKHERGIQKDDLAWTLLLACAASPFTTGNAETIKELAVGELDWKGLLNLAEQHGLVPVVYERVADLGGPIPPEARAQLKCAFELNARQTLWLTKLLFRVKELFQEQGIVALPYKGPVLAALLYDNVTARGYSDIDILIRPADVPRATAALQSAGFKPALRLRPREEKAYLATGYEYTFHGPKDPNLIEIQWRVLPRFYAIDFDVAGFIRRSRKIPIEEQVIQTLSNEDLLLVLCVHAAKHAWSKLSWIREIAELERLTKLDWDKVAKQVSDLGLRRILAVTFSIANTMCGAVSPTLIQRWIEEDGEAKRISQQLCRTMRRGEEPELESLAYFRLMAQVRERWRDRLRFWVRLAITPSCREWSSIRLPERMFPLYRLVRMARVARRLLRRG